MTASEIRVDYDQLQAIAQQFSSRAEAIGQLQTQLNAGKTRLQQGGWQGRGADAFFAEMDDTVLPAMSRLQNALQESQRVTLQIMAIMREAEEEAARLFRFQEEEPAASSSESSPGFWESVWNGTKDFFGGMYDEGKDMVLGLVNMVAHPVQTIKGLAYGVTHPKVLWEALTKPYVEAWESGHPWRAIGRGVMFIGSIVIGSKGADKLSKLAKAGRAVRVADEAAAVSARFGGSMEGVARFIGTVAEGSEAETAAARVLAEGSTQTFAGELADRVVLGPFKANPESGFLGYIGEAEAHGGRVFNTGENLWQILKPEGGNGRIWAVNREFLQYHLEEGIPRIELRGASVEDILLERPDSYSASEIRYLQRYAYQYGYRREGNAWIKVGDWRASHTGRNIGRAVGPGLDFLHTASQVAPGQEP